MYYKKYFTLAFSFCIINVPIFSVDEHVLTIKKNNGVLAFQMMCKNKKQAIFVPEEYFSMTILKQEYLTLQKKEFNAFLQEKISDYVIKLSTKSGDEFLGAVVVAMVFYPLLKPTLCSFMHMLQIGQSAPLNCCFFYYLTYMLTYVYFEPNRIKISDCEGFLRKLKKHSNTIETTIHDDELVL